VFNLAESFAGKSALESNVAALLNLIGLRYTGSSPAALLMAGDKSLTKKLLSFHSILTPQFATLYRGALDHVGELGFPLIVKPPQEDASLGITSKSVVRDIRELLGTMDSLQREFQSPVLVEEFVEGRMQAVAVESFNALRLRDYGRVDLRVTPDEKVYVIEVNPNCYLEQSGEFARAAVESGLAHDGLVARIVELAQGRYTR
jgi:D-alanine-D-alanine ligase